MKAMERSQFPFVSAGVFAVALVAVAAVQIVDPRHAVLPSAGRGLASLAACPFWTSHAQPPGAVTSPPLEPPVGGSRGDRSSSFAPPPQQAPALDLGGRLPAPATVSGGLSGPSLVLSFDRVPGAHAYWVWRNGQPIALVPDQSRPSLAITDPHPCADAFYTVQAVADQAGTDAARGQLSQPYQLAADGTVQPWAMPGNTAMQMTVVSYSDAGQAASGYDTGPGICAVDPRVVPWGISFAVPDYGSCYAADVRPTAEGRTVAVWLPAGQAAAWGVQDRVITLGPGPGRPSPPAQPSPSPSPSHRPSPSSGTTAAPTVPASPPTPGPTPSATPPPPPPSNLVANPGFETGGLAPWTCSPLDGVVSAPAHSGRWALAAAASSFDDAQCTQVVSVQPGHAYTLSAWVEGAYAFVGVSGTRAGDVSTFTPSAPAYTRLAVPFTTGAGTTSVTVFVHGWYAEGTVYADDVAIS